MLSEHKSAKTDKTIRLEPLTPNYQQDEHEVYVTALLEAVGDETVHNIALSGAYGIGKSSILREFASRLDGRCVEISLSTLAPLKCDDPAAETPTGEDTTTNRIQREIVKQLLYRESVRKMPLSRFRRIGGFSEEWAWRISCVLGAIVTIAFVLTGWAEMLSMKLLEGRLGIRNMALLIFFCAIFLVFAMQKLIHGRLNVREVAAGPAIISLDEGASTYFDQYLDEIIYFFQISDCDIVLFEDIDRFEDTNIFESLKAMNAILNCSPDIPSPIRFIYAVKDSIFDRRELKKCGRQFANEGNGVIDDAIAESVRSNRTKFFDIIVPVVPFITHANARDHLYRIMSKVENSVEDGLIDLASQHIPDVRILKNVRNEFVIFRSQIMSHGGLDIGLSESQLFAMMLYKNIYLMDFELIRFGTSKLDNVYRASRDLVDYEISQALNKIDEIKIQIGQIDEVGSRSESLGWKLTTHVERVMEAAGYQCAIDDGVFEFAGREVEDVNDKEFWALVTQASPEDVLTWRRSYYDYLNFSKANLEKALDCSFDVALWRSQDIDALLEEQNALKELVALLRTSDYSVLVEKSNALPPVPGCGQRFDEFVQAQLGRGLAYDLIRAGYLTQHYVLYSSLFQAERMTCRAMNYVIHHVDRNSMDVQYLLSADEVKSVLLRYGNKKVRVSTLYNVSILDWLFESDADFANEMISSLDERGDEQMHFLQAYLEGGMYPDRLAECLANLSVRAIDIFTDPRLKLKDNLRLRCVDIVLHHLGESKLSLNSDSVEYLDSNLSRLSAFGSCGDPFQARSLVNLLDDARVTVRKLDSVSSLVSSLLIERNLYDITRDNLSYVVGRTSEGVALDVIKRVNPIAYGYVSNKLAVYLSILTDVDLTVKYADSFASVLVDLEASDLSCVERVIEMADVGCVIHDLTKVSNALWPVLVSHRRCPSTWRNVTHYVNELGFEAELLVLLKDTRSISDVEDVNDLERNRFAIHILDSCSDVLDVDLAVQLVNSLHLGTPLDPSSIEHPTGDMLAGLLEGGAIVDCPDSYRVLVSSDWESRKMYILASSKFVTFMTPQLIGGDLPAILADVDIPRDIHEKILEDVELYSYGATGNGLSLIAERACEYEMLVPLSVLRDMVGAHVDAHYVLPLLDPLLDDVECPELRSILNGLGGVYADLTEVGRSVVRIPHICGSEKLLERLRDCGTVSTWRDEGSLFKVNRKRA